MQGAEREARISKCEAQPLAKFLEQPFRLLMAPSVQRLKYARVRAPATQLPEH